MTARQPRRARRRAAPATTLPRPVPGQEPEAAIDEATALDTASPTTVSNPVEAARARRSARRTVAPSHHRTHHVTTDYSHVHRDLITVCFVGVAVIAFIVAMSFVL
jgi:hypothetical protein